ncbi:hypothetical protein K502DRAFT_146689 [Neoconidiobolus thromboides FSU 785]|nr:hypothetical protein K502DRAFT_146689 [Neoconidiobolus thromboides FSU 785]
MSFNFSDKLSTSSSPSSASSLTQSSMTNRVNPQPKYLRDPTTMETISSTFNGISSFMMKNTLLGKAFQKNNNSSSNTPNSSSLSTSPMQKNEKTILSKVKPKAAVTCTEFDTIYLNREERRSCLLIGYSDGFHVWDIEDVGKINEIALIKLDIGEIKCLKCG